MKAKLLLLVTISLLCKPAISQEEKNNTEKWVLSTLKKHGQLLSESNSPDSTVLKECYHYEFSKYYLIFKHTMNVIKFKNSAGSREGSPSPTIDCAVWIPVKDIYHIDYIKSQSMLVIQTDKTFIATICNTSSTSKTFTMGFRTDGSPKVIGELNKAIDRLKQYYKMPPSK